MNSYLIWIPSIKEYKRFKEFKTKHQRCLSKLIEEDIEFVFYINSLLKELCIDDCDIDQLTLIDKYIICTYLRMRCIGTSIKVSSTCRDCGAKLESDINLNNIIENNIGKLDKSYIQNMETQDIKILCDIPLIKNEYEILKSIQSKNLDANSVESLYTYYTMSHIKEIEIKNNRIVLNDFNIEDSLKILQNLPMSIIQYIQSNFIIPLSKNLTTNILSLTCSNLKCNPSTLDLDLNSINSIIKLIFQENPTELLREIFYLSKIAHLNPQFIDNITPIERNILLQFLINENKKEQTNFPDKNKLQNYGFDLPESPSEFDSW